jgi:N-acetylmuramoyl-L-alanine amidase
VFRGVGVLFLVVLCSLFTITLALAAPKQTAGSAAASKEQPAQQYQAAKTFLVRLEQEKSLGQERSNWLKSAATFRQMHLGQKTGELGPPSLYMSAKVYRLAYARFRVAEDQDKAIASYRELADLYPGHTLADDALFEAAGLLANMNGQEKASAELYQKIVDLYPQGDQYQQARTRLSLPDNEKTEKKATNQSSAPPSPAHLAQVAPAKFWSSAGYSRIVIPTSGPVAYKAHAESGTGGPTNRISLELAQSALSPSSSRPSTPEKGGLLKQVQAVQKSENTVQMEFDLTTSSEYTIFSLNDPFRIIVDIHGQQETDTAAPATAQQRKPSEAQSAPPSPVPSSPATVEPAVAQLTEQKKFKASQGQPAAHQRREPLSLAQQLGLGVRKIVIDPGHGGKDPGAMAFGLKEKDIVLAIAKKLAKELKSTHRYDVVLTRTKDVYLSLEERTAIANTHKCDLFVSIHINAHADKNSSGIETYFLNLATDANAMRVAALENATSTHSIGELQDILANLMRNSKIDESTRLARFVHTTLIAGLKNRYNVRDLGVKQAPFYVLIGAEMPAILAELSFITNPDESKLLQTEQYQDNIASQIASGIVNYIDHQRTAAVRL